MAYRHNNELAHPNLPPASGTMSGIPPCMPTDYSHWQPAYCLPAVDSQHDPNNTAYMQGYPTPGAMTSSPPCLPFPDYPYTYQAPLMAVHHLPLYQNPLMAALQLNAINQTMEATLCQQIQQEQLHCSHLAALLQQECDWGSDEKLALQGGSKDPKTHLPWRQIRLLRNRAAHKRFNLDDMRNTINGLRMMFKNQDLLHLLSEILERASQKDFIDVGTSTFNSKNHDWEPQRKIYPQENMLSLYHSSSQQNKEEKGKGMPLPALTLALLVNLLNFLFNSVKVSPNWHLSTIIVF
ncbi:hypothetical protein BKA82DRAFT_7168 [Pisolithus tinctorius]|uniref:Uncharacterized protein n=1 Tax=Pisolithus tinctorius Marx 270 TaxID=870435 RepID=A0A0C3JRR5_PISTI|nr:hypothetical protein BKA82DRAFT_7168 [Pisolithus tinctorius]KIO11823.1 hypothetical protein M404DRAFT_7168 [Pisolithus tinctorius Marx 270]